MENNENKENKSVNPSSGAEKVENVEKELAAKKQAAENKKKPTAKKSVKKPLEEKKAVEKKQAKARIERAKKQKLSKQERKAKAEERRKLLKAKREERRAKLAAAKRARLLRKKQLQEKRKAEENEKRAKRQAEREERKKAIQQKKSERKKKPAQKKRESRHTHQRAPGFGGWLAAVISLGAVTLALGTVVTVGAVDMAKTNRSVMMGYKGTVYEFAGVMDNVDDDLDKARISSTASGQSRILTDLLVQTRLAEMSLEKFPLEAADEKNLTSFINQTAAFCEGALSKLRSGQPLDERDEQRLEYLYKISHSIRTELDKAISSLTDEDMGEFLKEKGKCALRDSLKSIEDMTLPENNPIPYAKTGNFPKSQEVKKSEKAKVSREKAENLCNKYFKGYEIEKTEYLGETLSPTLKAYDFKLTDKKGRELYVQIDKDSGSLLSFDFYEECSEKNFDAAACEEIAVSYLARLGYENMVAVYAKESGASMDYTFVYTLGGVTCYPDEVKVKVCMEKGAVIGLDATKFLKNHHSREAFSWKISQDTAQSSLRSDLNVLSARPVVLAVNGKERSAYEFFVSFDEQKYLIYTDATSGAELRIVNVKDLIV